MIVFCLFFLSSFALTAHGADVQPVHVENFPSVQDVKGSVAIEGTMSHARYIKREDVLVASGRRAEMSEMTSAGVLDTAGFTSVTISLQGEVKSASYGAGDIGVMLIPDEEPVIRALRDGRQAQFVIESVYHARKGEPAYFSAEQATRPLAFPRYKIFLYNTLTKAVEANVYFHLAN